MNRRRNLHVMVAENRGRMQRPRHSRRYCHGLPCQRGEQCPESRIRASSRREGATTPVEGSAARARQAPAELPAAQDLLRGGRSQPALRLLPARCDRIPAERLHHDDRRHQRRHRTDRDGRRITTCPRSERSGWRSSPSPGCRPIRTTPARSSTSSRTSRGSSSSTTRSGWYEGWMIHDLVVPPIGAARAD